jgi:hypothetical protein
MGYRDELEAMKLRLSALEQERAELGRARQELEACNRRIGAVDRELTDLRSRIEQESRRPLLDRVHIAAPCDERWDEMTGDDRVRFCGRCEKQVYNVSAMPRDEAEQLVRSANGRICLRVYQRRDGTVMTQDCPVGLRRRRRRRLLIAAAAVGGSVAGVSAALTPRMGALDVAPNRGARERLFAEDRAPDERRVLGQVVADPPPPAAPLPSAASAKGDPWAHPTNPPPSKKR